MNNFIIKIKKDKKDVFLALDIGTEAVKAIVLKKSQQFPKKIEVLGASIQQIDWFGSDSSEIDIIKKAVSSAVGDLKKKNKFEAKSLLISLPVNILKSRVSYQTFLRENNSETINKKEEEIISQEVLRRVKKEMSQKFNEDGIDAESIHFLKFNILDTKIDGYEVSSLDGFNGLKIDFKILFTFLPGKYLSWVEGIDQLFHFESIKIANQAEYLSNAFNGELGDAIFLDIGGKITQIILIKGGKLAKIEEVGTGARLFSKVLSQSLGISEERARLLKESYSRGELSEATSKQTKEIIAPAVREWADSLKIKLREWETLLPSEFFIFGGGSLMPDIKEILADTYFTEGLSFSKNPGIKLISPDYLKNLSFEQGKLNNSQFTPACILTYE